MSPFPLSSHPTSGPARVFFHIEWGGSDDLTAAEIWPDGDAPENPTVDDVIAEMRKSGSLSRLASDWNFDLQGVEVNGKDSGLR